jgi:hypothetical protein
LILLALLAAHVVGIVGLVTRANWGRVVGGLLAIFSLLNVPIGTAIGIVALMAFFKGERLFGPDRITHRRLKAAMQELKRAGV